MGNDYLLNRLNNPNANQSNNKNNSQIHQSQQVPTQQPTNTGDNMFNHGQQNITPVNNFMDKYEVKVEVTKELNDLMLSSNVTEPDDNFLRTTILSLLARYSISDLAKQEILTEMFYDLKGYGILQPFLDDDDVTEIIVCQHDNIWVEKFGKMIKTNVKFANEKELKNLIDKIVQPLGRRVDDSQPMVNARLKDKSRVNVVINPIAADGPTLDIRKFARSVFTIDDYLKRNSMCREMAEFIKWTVTGRKNVIVSGGTGSGKTTLLNCLSQFIPENEAIVTIEDLLELQLVQPCVRRLEARGKNAEGTGAITIRDCLVNALRMRPDRIIIGECRSHEVIDMLQAMNTGHDGSLTTVHANNPKDMMERLYVMYLMGGLDVPEKAVKAQIASAIHVVVQTQRLNDGTRKITQISEVIGFGKNGADFNNEYVTEKGLDPKFLIKSPSATDIYLQDIFKYDKLKGKFVATGWIPTFLEELKSKKYPITEDLFKGGDL